MVSAWWKSTCLALCQSVTGEQYWAIVSGHLTRAVAVGAVSSISLIDRTKAQDDVIHEGENVPPLLDCLHLKIINCEAPVPLPLFP